MAPLNSIYGVDSDFFKKEGSDFTKFQRLTNSGCASWACCLKSGSHFLFMKFQCTLTDSLKLFPSNTVLYRIMGMKKKKCIITNQLDSAMRQWEGQAPSPREDLYNI